MNWQMKAALWLILAVLLAGAGWKSFVSGREAGRAEVRQKWDEANRAAEQQARRHAEATQKVITRTVTKFVEKAAEERIVYRDIIKEVEKYVPSTLPLLPPDFRVYHDAAVTGITIPEAASAAGADVAPVAPSTVAATLADNYAACRYDQERLEALQEVTQALLNFVNQSPVSCK